MVSLAHILQAHRNGFFGEPPGNFISRLFKAKKLRHNEALYQQFGLKKGIHDPISSKDFGYSMAAQMPWLDMPSIGGSLSQNAGFQQLEPAAQAAVRQFTDQGYFILQGFFDKETTDSLAAEAGQLLAGTGGDCLPTAHRHSPLIAQGFFQHGKLLQLLQFILGKKIAPFQSVCSAKTRAQRAQADSLYLTTQPPGYHITCWAALDGTGEGSGPLFCYPGSHRLPCLTLQDLGIDDPEKTGLAETLRNYEDSMAEMLADNGLEKTFLPLQKGDLLVWHANLLHGSEADFACSGLAGFYCCEGVICYHEILRRAAFFNGE